MQRVGRSLTLRIAVPIVILILFLGASLYFLVLNTISEFVQDEIERDLKSLSHRAYNICNINFDDILQAGLADDPDTFIIKQALTLGQFEDFFRQESLEGLVYKLNSGELLMETTLPMSPEKIISESKPHGKIISLGTTAEGHFAYHFDFSPWDWQIIIIKSKKEYSHLITQVQRVHFYTLTLLVLASLFLVFFLHQSVKRPIDSIIKPVNKGQKPKYKGIGVFEFLSHTISIMMDSLQESEAKYRSLVETTSDWIWEMNIEGVYTYASPQVETMLGYKPEEVVGKSLFNMMPSDESKRMAEVFNDVSKKGEQIVALEKVCFHKDGRRMVLETSGVPFFNEAGKVTGYRGVDRNITERKQVEQSLRESEERFRTVLEANPDPVVVYDKTGNVIFFNPAFTKVFGWTLDECLGKRMDMFEPEESWPETRRMIEKVMAGESLYGIETRRLTKDGKIIYISLSAAVFHDRDGNPVGSVINLRDISEKKRLETQLQRAQKMEAIGALAGGVAHDLNNILSGIVSYPELLLLDLPQDSPYKKPLLTIQKSGAKAAAIVQDLLTLARRGVDVTEVVNLNHIISEYMKSPEHEKILSFHPNIHMTTDLETDLLDIMGSPVHLTKTVMNLISNAAEAILNSGTIMITTKNQYIDKPLKGYDAVIEGDYVVLIITDDGIGISEEDIEQIFEPFFTKKVMGRSGTGLGMSVVWSTVKDHNGYIDVHSQEGQGTTFTLYFPVTRKKRAQDEYLLPIEEYMGKGESILVVDDVEEQREIATGILTKLGYSVTSVSSGEEAVEYIKNNSTDLIILDMIMDPGMNGRETYERIVKINPTQKAVIASGFAETDDAKKAKKLGAGQYIKKPYTLEKIGIAVRDELKK